MKVSYQKIWEKMQNNGKRYFIFNIGGIYFGIATLILSWLSQILFSIFGYDHLLNLSVGDLIIQLIAKAVAAYPTGIIWGWIIWIWFERNYSKSK